MIVANPASALVQYSLGSCASIIEKFLACKNTACLGVEDSNQQTKLITFLNKSEHSLNTDN